MTSKGGPIVGISNEVLAIIFANLKPRDLKPRDLKATRLVCQLWSILAAAKLFERVYLSLRPKDLKVFRQIASHELYRKAVRKLIYDASTTQEQAARSRLSYCEYLLRGWGELEGSPQNDLDASRIRAIQASSLAKYLKDSFKLSYHVVAEDLELEEDITNGYEAYRKLARHEQKIATGERFEYIIVPSLNDLLNLEEVVISGSLQHDAPFCRSWPLTYLYPGYRLAPIDNIIYDLGLGKIINHCHTLLVRALSASGRKIKTLTIDETEDYLIPLNFFDLNSGIDPEMITIPCMLNAYSGLENLSLGLASIYDDEAYENAKWVRLQMPNLKTLRISHRGFYRQLKMIPFDMVSSWSFPRLRYLSLNQITISEKQLIGVVKEHPLLESFNMGKLHLSSGSWSSTLKFMREWLPKPEYILSEQVRDFENTEFWEQWYDGVGNPNKKLERYLNLGAAHPYLRTDRQASNQEV